MYRGHNRRPDKNAFLAKNVKGSFGNVSDNGHLNKEKVMLAVVASEQSFKFCKFFITDIDVGTSFSCLLLCRFEQSSLSGADVERLDNRLTRAFEVMDLTLGWCLMGTDDSLPGWCSNLTTFVPVNHFTGHDLGCENAIVLHWTQHFVAKGQAEQNFSCHPDMTMG